MFIPLCLQAGRAAQPPDEAAASTRAAARCLKNAQEGAARAQPKNGSTASVATAMVVDFASCLFMLQLNTSEYNTI